MISILSRRDLFVLLFSENELSGNKVTLLALATTLPLSEMQTCETKYRLPCYQNRLSLIYYFYIFEDFPATFLLIFCYFIISKMNIDIFQYFNIVGKSSCLLYDYIVIIALATKPNMF